METIPYIMGLNGAPNSLLRAAATPLYTCDPSLYSYSYPYLNMTPRDKQLLLRAGHTIGKNGFQISVDVSQFMPNELSVKVVDKCILVEGKHEEREDDHGHITRHFTRRYTLPKGYDEDKVVSTLSSDGVLTVSVPKPKHIEDRSNEHIIQIQHVGPAHLHVKRNAQEALKNTGIINRHN